MKKAVLLVVAIALFTVIVCGAGLLAGADGADVMGFGFATIFIVGVMGGIAWGVSEA